MKGEVEEGAEILVCLEGAVFVTAREGGRVEDDGVEGFAAADQFGEEEEDVLGEEAVGVRGDVVDLEVCLGAVEGFSREVDREGFCAAEGGDDGEGAGVGKGIEEAAARILAEEEAIGALIEEESYGVAGGEVQAVEDVGL